jgi:uncharacterized membrane protein (DUF106 family)
MWPILRTITKIFDGIFAPFSNLHPWVGLAVVSVVTGVVMLLIFGKTSNQKKIGETKDKLKAYVMEMWIFRNDTRVMFLAIGNVFRNNVQYLRHSLRPLVFLIVPVLVIMVQLGIRYADEPVMPGQVSVVTAHVREGARPSEIPMELTASKGVRIVSPALRIDSEGDISWKVMAEMPGEHVLSVTTPDGAVTKALSVGPERRLTKVGALRARANSWNAFLYPSEEPIPSDSVIESIHVTYPHRELRVFGLTVHWLIAFFIISVAAGFALKGVFGIEV